MIYLDAGNENSQNQLFQQHHHSQTNANSALMLVRFLNCLGKAAVGIVYYVDCTVKDELIRRKEAKQSSITNKKTRNPTKKRKTPDDDSSLSINDTTNQSMDDEMCQVFGDAEAEDPVDNEIGLYIQSLCEKNSLLMQYKNILEQVKKYLLSNH
jgi:hypothetical protein